MRETLAAIPTSLAEVLGNGKRYLVPPFQRDYAWGETEWSELWADIRELGKPGDELGSHYLGALVLQPTGERGEMKIIDGQQRLVTLNLLALAVIVRIERLAAAGRDAEDNRERVRLLRERFVSTKDTASLQHHSRLRLNDNDDGFYQTYLVQGTLPQHSRALKGSALRLYQAFTFFERRLAEHLGATATGADLAQFLEKVVATRLRFIEIRVEDDETAFIVFETLNARGVALGTADLLKNFVFATAAKGGIGDLDLARNWWNQILGLVPMDQVASLLFHKLATRVPELREKRVFSEVKRRVPAVQNVFEFLRDLKEAAEIYTALDDPGDELWADLGDSRRSVRVLAILGAKQVRPIVLAAFSKLVDRPDRLARLLRNLAVISVRASIARVNTGDLQREYQSTALKIEAGELKSPLAIARALANVTPSDDEFRSAFATLSIDPRGRLRPRLRYLLAELEGAMGGHAIDFEAADATIEHILPENPAAGWELFAPEERAAYVTRLGNLTPLERTLNRSLGATDFEHKRAVYERSRYGLTNRISATAWNPAAVVERQRELSDLAVNLWKIVGDE